MWNLTLKATTKVGDVVSIIPKGGSEDVPVGFALEAVTHSSADIVVPVLLCLGLAYGAANSVSA